MKLPNIKGKNKFETAENLSIAFIIVGAVILSTGLGLAIFNPKGASAVLAMIGSFIAFISTVALILVWLAKEIFGSE